MTIEIAGLKPTVHYDGGPDGRVVVADSLSYFEHEPWTNDVTVEASFVGAPTAAICMRQGAKAWIAHEGSPGKDKAGISGLALAQQFGIPAAAIATMEAQLSGERSLLTGRISHANDAAKALGVSPGQTGDEAARLMLKAPPGKPRDFSGVVDEETHEMVSPLARIYERGYDWMFLRHIEQADKGFDFCFLKTDFGAPVGEPDIFSDLPQ